MRPQTMVGDPPVALDQQLDQRRDQRHQFSRSAVVSVLGKASHVLRGEIRNVSKGGTQLQLNQPLRAGSLLRIEYDDNLLLGEVVYCQQGQNGWVLGIRIEHSLCGLTDLGDAMCNTSLAH
jgi:hypothetical protein